MDALIEKILEEVSKNLEADQTLYLESLNRLLQTLLAYQKPR